MKITIEKIVETLKKKSLRVTKSRLSVAEVLVKNSEKFLTSEGVFNIISKKKNLSCDQVSVYRILTTFEELGIVVKSQFHNEAARYSLSKNLGEKHSHSHVHYFKCNNCNKVEPFRNCFISKKEKELIAKGYSNLSHHIEINGLCPTCSK